MRILTIREMRASLGDLDEILAAEGEILVVRHGNPVARILPIRTMVRPSHADLRASLAKDNRAKRTAAEDIRNDRDER